jgi:hypothetical protein
MNNQRYNSQQNSQQNSNRFQYQNRAQYSQKETLMRELRYLERDLVALDAQIDALGEKGRALEAAKKAHMQAIPLAIAQVALSTLGVRYLPPTARSWHYKHQQYLRSEELLKQQALSLHARKNGLVAQIEQIEIQIEMLQYQP